MKNLGVKLLAISILMVTVGAHAESLFTSGHEGLFDDHKAKYIGDSITVVIVESASTYQKNDRDMTNKSSASVGPGTGYASFLNSATGIPSQGSFKAEGAAENKGSFNAKITARITKILENGELEVVGSKKTQINGESQIIKIKGTVRREDIDPNNTVASTYIADAEIVYESDGELNNNIEPGFMTKIFNMVF
jgi:flagellar L-ring protein FlgH